MGTAARAEEVATNSGVNGTMGETTNTYQERRRLEAENAMLREKRENERLKSEAQSLAILDGVSALFSGTGSLFVAPENGGWRIRFDRR